MSLLLVVLFFCVNCTFSDDPLGLSDQHKTTKVTFCTDNAGLEELNS